MLDVVLQRLRPWGDASLSDLLHACHLFGPDTLTHAPGGESMPVLDLICSTRQSDGRFGSAPTLVRTRYGLRFPLVFPWMRSMDQSNAESHPGQGLATLACLGVPLRRRIAGSEEEALYVQHILDDLIANFVLEGELYWDSLALAIYLPPQRSWQDKFGRTYTFDDLAHELVDRSVRDSSCAGTHKLIALSVLLRVDAHAPILSRQARSHVRAHLRDIVHQLCSAELPDGGWSLHWTEPHRSNSDHPFQSIRPSQVILATGHHLEWLMLLPSHLQPPKEVLEQAAQHCLRLLHVQTESQDWVRTHYCPAIHAARSVWILTRRESRAGHSSGALTIGITTPTVGVTSIAHASGDDK